MSGYREVFFEAPGTVTERICLVCGTKCLVERNRMGPTSWAASMARKHTLHDYFYCPNRDQAWHKKALELLQAIDSTPSKRLASLIKLDLIELLEENGCRLPDQPE